MDIEGINSPFFSREGGVPIPHPHPRIPTHAGNASLPSNTGAFSGVSVSVSVAFVVRQALNVEHSTEYTHPSTDMRPLPLSSRPKKEHSVITSLHAGRKSGEVS